MSDKTTIKERYFTIVNKLGSVQRDAKSVFAGAKYASLSNIQKHLAPLLAEQNCFIDFDFGSLEGDVYKAKLTLTACDLDETKTWNFDIPIDNTQKNRVQAFGATTTYGQRYALCVAFQIALDDEDPDKQQDTKQPAKPATLPLMVIGSDKYKDAVKWLATVEGAKLATLKAHYRITADVEQKLQEDAMNYETKEV